MPSWSSKKQWLCLDIEAQSGCFKKKSPLQNASASHGTASSYALSSLLLSLLCLRKRKQGNEKCSGNCSRDGDIDYSLLTHHSDTKNYIYFCLCSVWFSEWKPRFFFLFLGRIWSFPDTDCCFLGLKKEERGEDRMLNTFPSSMALPDFYL